MKSLLYIGESESVDRTFFQTEIPTAKANPNITHIDHVGGDCHRTDKQTLFKALEALGDPQHHMYAQRAHIQVIKLCYNKPNKIA